MERYGYIIIIIIT